MHCVKAGGKLSSGCSFENHESHWEVTKSGLLLLLLASGTDNTARATRLVVAIPDHVPKEETLVHSVLDCLGINASSEW